MKTKLNKIVIILVLAVSSIALVGCEEKEKQLDQEEIVQEEIEEKINEPILENVDNYLAALNYLGFDDIDINRKYTLEELVVYLVDFFGKSEEAKNLNYQCPYKNVKDENESYIAYAYANWYLIGNDDFVLDQEENSLEFMSTLLHMMNYSDIESNDAIEFAKSIGINYNSKSNTVRGDYLTEVLWQALGSKCEDGKLLKDKLIKSKMFTKNNYEDAEYLARGEDIPKRVTTKKETAAESQPSYTGGGNVPSVEPTPGPEPVEEPSEFNGDNTLPDMGF